MRCSTLVSLLKTEGLKNGRQNALEFADHEAIYGSNWYQEQNDRLQAAEEKVFASAVLDWAWQATLARTRRSSVDR